MRCLSRGAPRLRTDRRAQSARRGYNFGGQYGRRTNRGYPAVTMSRGPHRPSGLEGNGLSNTPTDEEYKDDR